MLPLRKHDQMAFMGIKYLEESLMNLIRMAWIDFRINALVEENKG